MKQRCDHCGVESSSERADFNDESEARRHAARNIIKTFAETMAGEQDLVRLIEGSSPVLSPDEYVFVSFPSSRYGDHPELSPIAFVVEDEGITLVIPRAEADARQLGYQSVFKRITLNIHSSLDAVGLTAAVSTTLSNHGISANMIAGFFHDHIFVPSSVADEALGALQNISP